MKADKEKLIRRILEDGAFADKLATMDDEKAILKFINENGINVTEQDLKELVEKAAKVDWTKVTINGTELPDEMLENVAGGSKQSAKEFGKAFLYGVSHPFKSIGQMIRGDWDGLKEDVDKASLGEAIDSVLGFVL